MAVLSEQSVAEHLELQENRVNTEATVPYLYIQLDIQLGAQMGLISMDFAQEVLVLPSERLTMMPNMPPYALGLVSHRSRIFWLIDLPQLLGLNPIESGVNEYDMAILRVRGFWVGIATIRTHGIRRLSPEAVRSAHVSADSSNIPAEMERYIQGWIPETGWVLDAEAIALPASSVIATTLL
jgi:positive phototaxis protein PixI